MRTTPNVLLTTAVLVCFAQVAQAAAITGVTNGGFELPGQNPIPANKWGGYSDNVVPTGWSVAEGAAGASRHDPLLETAEYGFAMEGNIAVGLEIHDVTWEPSGVSTFGIQQDLGQMAAGETYHFSAMLGGSRFGDYPDYLYVANYSIRFVDATTSSVLSEITEADFALVAGATITATMDFTAPDLLDGNTLRLVLGSHSVAGYHNGGGNIVGRALIDDVSVTVEVPEPSTLILLCIGALGFFTWAWRRRVSATL